MGRLFDGTDDGAGAAINLSAYSLITVAWWGWWDSYNNGSNEPYFEYGNPNWAIAGGWISYPDHPGGAHLLGMHTGAIAWQDTFPRPSAAAWHSYMHVFNRATPANLAWVDGVAQSLTTISHTAGSYGNFANSSLYYASRASTSLFADCRMAEVAIWGGVALGLDHARALVGAASPLQIQPENLVYYAPLLGADSPEPDYIGGANATLAGTSATLHPQTHPGILVP